MEAHSQGLLDLRGRQTASTILDLIKLNFLEIPEYNYEQGAPSHRYGNYLKNAVTLARWSSTCIPLPQLLDVISSATAILKTEHTLLHISNPPVYVIGDLHGNFKVVVPVTKTHSAGSSGVCQGIWIVGAL